MALDRIYYARQRVFATAEASFRLSVCHTAVLCQNDATVIVGHAHTNAHKHV